MKKCMIAIAVCSLLMLTACNKSTENVTETTTAAVSSETTTVTVTEAETTAQSEEETLSVEELENQIAAAESVLADMKEEEAAQAGYDEVDPFEDMWISAMKVDPDLMGYPNRNIILSVIDPEIAKKGTNIGYILCCENTEGYDKEKDALYYNACVEGWGTIVTSIGAEVIIKVNYDEDWVKEKFNTVLTRTEMKITVWDTDENGEYIHISNGEMQFEDYEW